MLDASGLLWCHVPNGGQRHPAVAKKLKAEGVKAGVPDVLIFNEAEWSIDTHGWMDNMYNGLALELKVGGNKPTAAQVEWHERLRKNGWRVEVCYTLDEVFGILRECYPSKFT